MECGAKGEDSKKGSRREEADRKEARGSAERVEGRRGEWLTREELAEFVLSVLKYALHAVVVCCCFAILLLLLLLLHLVVVVVVVAQIHASSCSSTVRHRATLR